jgi:hypothetical protein
VRGQLAAADCETQAVAGHRIDEARCVTSKQKSGTTGCHAVHRERAKCSHPGHLPCACKTSGKDRIASQRLIDDAIGVHALRAEHVFQLADDTDVDDAAGERCDADVAVGADMHLTAR